MLDYNVQEEERKERKVRVKSAAAVIPFQDKRCRVDPDCTAQEGEADMDTPMCWYPVHSEPKMCESCPHCVHIAIKCGCISRCQSDAQFAEAC